MFILRRMFIHEIEFAINDLMMTIRMQGRMNTTINCQVRLSVKVRSLEDNELSNRWVGVGSDISCCSPCIVLT